MSPTSQTTIDSTDVFIESKIDSSVVCWEELDRKAKNMTEMVTSDGFTDRFKKTEFGIYFNDDFYDQSQGKSRFENITYVYGLSMLIAFEWTDINFDAADNPIALYARQYEDISDIEGLTFIFECSFENAELTKVKNVEDVYIEIARSATTRNPVISVADVQNIEKLNNRLWNSPDYCKTVRERVIYFIFEDDNIVKKYGLSLEIIVKDYKGALQCINDCLLIEAMNKI